MEQRRGCNGAGVGRGQTAQVGGDELVLFGGGGGGAQVHGGQHPASGRAGAGLSSV
jgi:hypothetical protein